MKAYLANSFSDEEGAPASEGKLVYLRGSKNDVSDMCRFLNAAVEWLENHDSCHMHFSDFLEGWNKNDHIDLVIDVGQD